jgi:hypothetical protein
MEEIGGILATRYTTSYIGRERRRIDIDWDWVGEWVGWGVYGLIWLYIGVLYAGWHRESMAYLRGLEVERWRHQQLLSLPARNTDERMILNPKLQTVDVGGVIVSGYPVTTTTTGSPAPKHRGKAVSPSGSSRSRKRGSSYRVPD